MATGKYELPEALRGFITMVEVDDGPFAIGALFKRKFGDAPPDVPHHNVAFYRDAEGALHPATYAHYRPLGDLYLVGGACTDGAVLRRMSEAERSAVTTSGGLYLHLLRWAFARYADRCEAYFGYCGDPRAYEVDIAAGFVDTDHPKLLAHWHRPEQHEVLRRALIAKAHAIGPF